MKKTVLVTVLMLCAALTLAGCGCSRQKTNTETTTTKASDEDVTIDIGDVSTEATTQGQSETTTAQQGAYTKEQLVEKTGTFIAKLNEMEKLMATDVQKDTSCTFTNGSKTYYRFDTNSYTCVADIKSFVASYLTQNAINQRYSDLYNNTGDMYMDVADGNQYGVKAGLYVLDGGKGYYVFDANDVTIQDGWSEQAYTAVSHFTSAGGATTLTLKFICNNDGWFIDDINIQ